MKQIFIVSLILVFAFIFTSLAYADCRGCCSWHGGVVCRNGVTMCNDGTPLSSKCRAKGCNKCGDINFVKPIIIKKHIKKKSVIRKTSRNAPPGIYVVPFDNEGITECVCNGLLVLTDRGCPCEQPDKK
jgi:hypothetical protein